VRERLASRQLKAGELMCVHVLPTGSFEQFFVGIQRVSLKKRDELVELLNAGPDEMEVVSALTERFGPHSG
jgi:hypothetical protein